MSGLRLDVLGFEWSIVEQLRRLSALPYGMLLVTGPTGSGKTTTLYAAISETNTGQDKIITIEDPVEYQLQGVLQIPVNEEKGLHLRARGLRSIREHDPDAIMVGEIRDPETAQIAASSQRSPDTWSSPPCMPTTSSTSSAASCTWGWIATASCRRCRR